MDAASKAALEQLTRSWAVELAADGIRVNALAPGPTESQALAAAEPSAGGNTEASHQPSIPPVGTTAVTSRERVDQRDLSGAA